MVIGNCGISGSSNNSSRIDGGDNGGGVLTANGALGMLYKVWVLGIVKNIIQWILRRLLIETYRILAD